VRAGELLDSLVVNGLARSTQAQGGESQSVVVAGVEVGVTDQPREGHLRARWRQRVGSTGTPYLLVADQPGENGSILTLGLSSPDGPIRLLSVEALSEVIERAAQLDSLDAIRYISGEIDRLDQKGIPGVKLKGLLTMHTLDVRLREDSDRWVAASTSVGSVTLVDDWRTLLTEFGYEACGSGVLYIRRCAVT